LSDIRSALQTLADARLPTEAEARSISVLETTLVALATARIEDDTVRRPAEREIWFHEWARVQNAADADLRRESAGHIPYLQLFKQPDDYRCRVVSMKGAVKLAYRVAAEPNYLGVKEYVV